MANLSEAVKNATKKKAPVEKPATAPAAEGEAKAKKTVNKRTVLEYRESLIEKQNKIQEEADARKAKLQEKIDKLDEKHAARVQAMEELKACGKTPEEMRADIEAEEARLRGLRAGLRLLTRKN